MLIAIDVRFASGDRAGVGRYAFNLMKGLVENNERHEIFLYGNEIPEKFKKHNVNILTTAINYDSHPAQEVWENIYLPLSLNYNRIDVFHSPAFFLFLFAPGVKKIVTIHDLAVFKFPEDFPYRFAKYLQLMIRLSTKVADRIIADSNAVKNDLIDILGLEEKKISVTYLGIDEMFAEGSEKGIDNFKEAKGLTRGFILYAGTIEPRKNIINLIKAFALMKNRGLPHKLVLAGKRGWLSEPIFEEIKRSRFRNDISLTGYIPDEELKLYYSSCDVFVYPSLYEGFGLPPLEAMACGAPVVVSDIPVFRELLHNSAIFVNPESPESIAGGIETIIINTGLKDELKKKGTEVYKKYTWRKTAEETLKVYHDVL